MTKFLGVLAGLLVAAGALAQSSNSADPLSNFAVRLDGGDVTLSGSVTSVGLSGPAEYTVACGTNPVVDAGTLCFAWAAGSAPSSDDATLISVSNTYVRKAIADCTGAGKAVTYAVATHTFGCNTISGGSVATDPIFDAKGDLPVGTGADTAAKLTVGANNTTIVADSAQSTGLKYLTLTAFIDTLASTRGMLLLRGASNWAGLAVGTAGQRLMTDGTDVTWGTPGLDDMREFKYIEEFCGSITAAHKVANAGAGAAFGALSGPGAANPCVLKASTGTTTTGASGYELTLTTDTGNITPGTTAITFQTRVQVPTLSTVGEEFTVRVGLCDRNTGLCSNGYWFLYDRLTDTHWQMCVGNGDGSPTCTATANTVTAGQWDVLRIIINSANTSIGFFVNGTEATNSPITTGDIPSNATCVGFNLLKSAGTTNRDVYQDYYSLFRYVAAR